MDNEFEDGQAASDMMRSNQQRKKQVFFFIIVVRCDFVRVFESQTLCHGLFLIVSCHATDDVLHKLEYDA